MKIDYETELDLLQGMGMFHSYMYVLIISLYSFYHNSDNQEY